jgi:hypothetical protein
MSLIVRSSGSFAPAPEGLHNAVCVDVVNLGMVDGPWGMKHNCRLVWEIDKAMKDGKRFIVGKRYTLSLHKKSTLYKDIKSWRGVMFTPEELKGFDLERVIGAPCQLVIVHEEKNESIYANVSTIMKADPNNKLKPAGTYVRVCNRPDAKPIVEADPDPEPYDEFPDEPPFEADDSDVGF